MSLYTQNTFCANFVQIMTLTDWREKTLLFWIHKPAQYAKYSSWSAFPCPFSFGAGNMINLITSSLKQTDWREKTLLCDTKTLKTASM